MGSASVRPYRFMMPAQGLRQAFAPTFIIIIVMQIVDLQLEKTAFQGFLENLISN